MTEEQKMEWLAKVMGSGRVSVGQFIMDNHGTMHIDNKQGGSDDKEHEEESRQTAKAKDAIMEYVGRLKPVVRPECLATYDTLWSGILELREVKLLVYNKGKQQDTTFNRNLVAQIVYQLGSRVYEPTANTVQMAECLEPGKGASHSVRQKLGEMPEKTIKKSVDQYIESAQQNRP